MNPECYLCHRTIYDNENCIMYKGIITSNVVACHERCKKEEKRIMKISDEYQSYKKKALEYHAIEAERDVLTEEEIEEIKTAKETEVTTAEEIKSMIPKGFPYFYDPTKLTEKEVEAIEKVIDMLPKESPVISALRAILKRKKDESTKELGEIEDWKDESPFTELMNLCTKYKNVILDCWEWLKPKERTVVYACSSTRDKELLENQEELINALRKILEPVVDEILKVED